MPKINSKKKGSRGELEWANFVKEHSHFDVRRTAQYNGKELGSLADVVGIPGLHQEVKRVESLNITKAMEQAIRDNAGADIPIVAHRKNQKNWLVTLQASDFLLIYQIYLHYYTNHLIEGEEHDS